MSTEQQRKANLKMAWVLAALAALSGLGFFAKTVLLGG